MPLPQSIRTWFEAIVRDAVRERVAECIPCPDTRPAGVRFQSAGGFTELTQPPEIPPMLNKEISITKPADTMHGYASDEPVVIINRAGNPLDPQPPVESITVSVSDPAVIGEARLLSDRRVFFNPLDAALPGATADIRISAVETGEDDDAVIHYTVGEDRIGSAAVGEGFTELTEAPI